MMAENISIENGNENIGVPQKQVNDPNGGIASETQGRKVQTCMRMMFLEEL